MLRLRPLLDKLIVEQVKPEQMTPGGIALPDLAQQHRNVGTVLRVGPEVTHIKEGDTVLFSQYAGQEITFDEKPYLLLAEEDIHAIEEPEE